MKLTAAELRADLEPLLERVLATGCAIEVDRPGGTVVLSAKAPSSQLDRLARREGVINGDPEDLVSIDWSACCP